ncbi:MAG: tRNA uridine-5-carboxymethylaminomethyl(34) synthesis GTPase MnmE [Tannerellaceae bacterium]|jgi:tRNA modification GTPase|nr:tRNA uridine-5-carboxymethylaminomethyl(34) synthesis GTPase MnmE [Tannerellaceae bacterium]
MQDTICAIATAPGRGGIAVVRVSGPDAFIICEKVASLKNAAKKLGSLPAGQFAFGYVHSGSEILDEVIISGYRAPHSYTGEDTIELSCHGSLYIQQQLLQLLIENGCRLAQPGEFTQRAFINGKLDLSQAEAVADLISATTPAMHRLSMSQIRGGFGKELNKLRAQLLDFASLIELELDFGEEDVEFANREHLRQLSCDIERLIHRLAESFNVGNVIKNGIPVAIVGETNAGKSTLLNTLVGEERAIVSDIHGTTRDTIEDVVHISGLAFRFIDTAGLRNSSDEIENIGIRRAIAKVEQASIILLVLDSTAATSYLSDMLPSNIADKKIIKVFNKTDLLGDGEELRDPLPNLESVSISISARENQNVDRLKHLLVEVAAMPQIHPEDLVVTNARHYEALTQALSAIRRVNEGLSSQLSADFISQDIRECAHYIGEITGRITTDEILGNIFSRFCIGK